MGREQSKGICMPLLYLLEASYSYFYLLRAEASALAWLSHVLSNGCAGDSNPLYCMADLETKAKGAKYKLSARGGCNTLKNVVLYLFSFYFTLEDSIKFLPEVMFLKLKEHNVIQLCDPMIFYKPVLSLIDFYSKVMIGQKEKTVCWKLRSRSAGCVKERKKCLTRKVSNSSAILL